MPKTTKQTPLYDWHLSHQAKMENFADYMMPMWYASAKSEHLSVLTGAGLFDTSHMDTLTVRGKHSFDLLQNTFTKDLNHCIGPKLTPLVQGRCAYGAFLDDQGRCIDDAIIFKMGDTDFMVVVNAGMGAVIAKHLEDLNESEHVQIINWSGKLGKVDLQGPFSVPILQEVLNDADRVLNAMPYFSFKGGWPLEPSSATVTLKNGVNIIVSRTGYTGEVGFEIFCPVQDVVSVWEMLLSAGQQYGIAACGLAARDSLRAGAVLPLSHQDIGDWPFIGHPWPFALPFDPRAETFTKSFIGDKALLKARHKMYTYAFTGFDPRKISLAGTRVHDQNKKEIGTVLTCTTDMGIGRHKGTIFSITSPDKPADFKPRGLCCGFLKVSMALSAGEKVSISDQRRAIEVEITTDIRPARTARMPLQKFLNN
ncbi:MAG: aminomethyl transferase family protein [Desulfobacteraceae bacterium]|nr:aminomethyl transferase family protein [Desulfobacteraceae bacterium]